MRVVKKVNGCGFIFKVSLLQRYYTKCDHLLKRHLRSKGKKYCGKKYRYTVAIENVYLQITDRVSREVPFDNFPGR